jgi:acetyl esterase/lipase
MNDTADPVAELIAGIARLGARFDESVLAATRTLYAPHVAAAGEVTATRDLAYGPHERHRIDLFRPMGAAQGSRLPILLFVHGGGFTAGDKSGAPRFYANVGEYFARHGYLAATMNYRLAPEGAWPAGNEDVATAVDWLAAEAEAQGGDAASLHLLGQSAGASHVAGYLFDPALRARATSRVRSAALMSGFYRAQEPLNGGQKAYFGGDPAQYARRSPSSHVEGSGVPLLLSLAQYDPPAQACQSLDLAAAITRARGECPPVRWFEGHNHVSTVMSLGSPQDDVGRCLRDFFDKHR